jgi:DNA-binding CsgD family transcriptional regulator
MLNGAPVPKLRGRRGEREALDRLVEAVRAGQSRVLVLRGDAGAGRTALLDHLVRRASGSRVARAAGVESEMQLPFAGLQQLCARFPDRLERLPGHQRDALSMPLGLSAGVPPERLLLGLAVLGLLSEVAGERSLICVVDDAQWLDRDSAQTLAFVARRLRAEPVGLVFAVREPAAERDLMGLPELTVPDLPYGDACALLESAVHGRLDARVRDRMIAETHGNPRALLELARGLTPVEMAGGFGLPRRMAPAGRSQESVLRRLHGLPRATRRLLLAAAADPVGDVPLLWRAAARLGIRADAAAPAEAADLIELGTRVRFRHPLVRSAAYSEAAVQEVREVHRALAEASDPETDPERRAWHRAHAAGSPDETVAADLERSTALVRRRGGAAAAAAFLERATALSPDPARRGARALDAAQAMFEAAAIDRAFELLATAELTPLDELQRARLERLRAVLTSAPRPGRDGPRLLLDAARRLEPLDTGLARETYLEALGAAIVAGRLSGGRAVRQAADAGRAAPPAPRPGRAADLLLDGLSLRLTEGYAAAVPLLRRALQALAGQRRRREEDLRWLWLASSVSQELWDDASWDRLTAQALAHARDAGALTSLPIALAHRASVHVHAGQFAEASALIEEADGIGEVTGTATFRGAAIVLAAWRGPEASALGLIRSGIEDAAGRGEGRLISVAEYARAVLYNGHGRYEDALAGAQRACEHDDLGLRSWALVELVEANARIGNLDAATRAHRRLEERTSGVGSDWALGIRARSRALLSDGHAADVLYRDSIERLAHTRIVVHRARAQLLYGEWLRRERRRVDAREQLRAAHDTFSRIGAEGFAERARRELIATGETVRKRDVATYDELTSQEAQIARLAREGHTNPEIGTQLFLSPRTIEWHLSKVFAKLSISSRRELRAAISDPEPGVRAA